MEPLYMPDHREGVATAVDSLIQYSLYGQAAAAGDAAGAGRIFTSILDYNRYDCLSTPKLRDWLLSLRLPVRRSGRQPVDLVRGIDCLFSNSRPTLLRGSYCSDLFATLQSANLSVLGS